MSVQYVDDTDPDWDSMSGQDSTIPVVRVIKVDEHAVLPVYSSPIASFFDLHAVHDGIATSRTPVVFDTGLIFQIPKNFVMLVVSRSSSAFDKNWHQTGSVRVIDSGYQHTVKCRVFCEDDRSIMRIKSGDLVGHAVIVPAWQAQFVMVDES